jgi:hypothetical protein
MQAASARTHQKVIFTDWDGHVLLLNDPGQISPRGYFVGRAEAVKNPNAT